MKQWETINWKNVKPCTMASEAFERAGDILRARDLFKALVRLQNKRKKGSGNDIPFWGFVKWAKKEVAKEKRRKK